MASHPEYTGKKVDAGGFFDDLMEALKSHLEQEFNKQRIRGADYTKVYLGSVEAALGNATQYLTAMALIEEQRRKIEAEILAIAAEREKTELEKERLRFEIDELLPLQKLKVEAENELIRAQVEDIRFKIDNLYPLEKIKLENETKLVDAQVRKTEAEVLTAEWNAKTAEYNLNFMLPEQLLKSEAERKLINQRYVSEVAQTSGTLPDNSKVGGMMGKQIELYEEQRQGFIKDAEHKIAKLYTDVWSVVRSTNEDALPPESLENKDINVILKSVVKKATGVDITT